jgi:hypothetical protein
LQGKFGWWVRLPDGSVGDITRTFHGAGPRQLYWDL